MTASARMTGAGRASRIGPGALVVVVGPSGAGKDTLIALARALCAQDPQIDPRIETRDRPQSCEQTRVSAPHRHPPALHGGRP